MARLRTYRRVIAVATMLLGWAWLATVLRQTPPPVASAGPERQIVVTFFPIFTRTPTTTPTRTPTPINIGNFVWDDLDADGRQDTGEPGMAGVTVQLWNSAKTLLIDQTVTDANGSYSLIAPTPGNYRVRVLLPGAQDFFSPKDQAGGDDLKDSDINPSGTNAGFTDVLVLPSNLISITSIDAGITKFRTPTPTRTPTPINIGNFVWVDLNGNGVQDVGEPGLGGVNVQLWNSDKTWMIDQTYTALNGSYSLIAPGPGDYRVRVLPPSGASFGPKDQGGDDLKDSDINPSGANAGFTDVLTLPSNLISITSIDAALINVPPTPTGTLSPIPTRAPLNTPTYTATRTPTHSPTRTPTGTPELKPSELDKRIYLPALRK